MPKFMKVATTDELEDEQAKLVEVEGQKIALFRVREAFYALSDTCTHRGGPLSEGTVEGAEVTCPWPRGEVRHQDRGCPEAAGGTRGQELPGAGHRRRHRDRSVRPGLQTGAMPHTLNGLRVVSFESRRAAEMAELIRNYGGEPIQAPSMREVPLTDEREALA